MMADAASVLRPWITDAIIDALFPRLVELQDLCSTPPPPLPNIDIVKLAVAGQLPLVPQLLVDWLVARWKQENWNTYCECAPPPGGTGGWSVCASGSALCNDVNGCYAIQYSVNALPANTIRTRVRVTNCTGDFSAVYQSLYVGTFRNLAVGTPFSNPPGEYANNGTDCTIGTGAAITLADYGHSAADTHVEVVLACGGACGVDWFLECETSGSPAPLPYVPPAEPPPPAIPTPPVTAPAACSLDDVCAQLDAIRKMLGPMAAELQRFRQYELPFRYAIGGAHVGLTAEGSFGISRLLGMRIVVTAYPTPARALVGNPDYIYDLGWLSISTPEGMVVEKRLSQVAFVWVPDQMPLATTFAWALGAGVVVTATELVTDL